MMPSADRTWPKPKSTSSYASVTSDDHRRRTLNEFSVDLFGGQRPVAAVTADLGAWAPGPIRELGRRDHGDNPDTFGDLETLSSVDLSEIPDGVVAALANADGGHVGVL